MNEDKTGEEGPLELEMPKVRQEGPGQLFQDWREGIQRYWGGEVQLGG